MECHNQGLYLSKGGGGKLARNFNCVFLAGLLDRKISTKDKQEYCMIETDRKLYIFRTSNFPPSLFLLLLPFPFSPPCREEPSPAW